VLDSSAAGGAELLEDLETLLEYDELGSSYDDGYEFAEGISVGRGVYAFVV
jgi:hypothetical protein